MMRILFALLLLSFGGAVQAALVTIDFEEVPIDGFLVQGANPLITQGFSFSSPAPQGIVEVVNSPPNTRALHWCAIDTICSTNDEMSMTAIEPKPFRLVSLDLGAEVLTESFVLTGFYATGGSIQTNISLSARELTTFSLGVGWSNLSSLNLDPTSGQSIAVYVDNIVLDVVPIPAAVWLFGSGLGLLGWLRVRQNA